MVAPSWGRSPPLHPKSVVKMGKAGMAPEAHADTMNQWWKRARNPARLRPRKFKGLIAVLTLLMLVAGLLLPKALSANPYLQSITPTLQSTCQNSLVLWHGGGAGLGLGLSRGLIMLLAMRVAGGEGVHGLQLNKPREGRLGRKTFPRTRSVKGHLRMRLATVPRIKKGRVMKEVGGGNGKTALSYQRR